MGWQHNLLLFLLVGSSKQRSEHELSFPSAGLAVRGVLTQSSWSATSSVQRAGEANAHPHEWWASVQLRQQLALCLPRSHISPYAPLLNLHCICGDAWPQVAIVNPTSGQGKGASIFSRHVLPLLRDVAGLSVEVHATTGKHHATKIVRELQSIDKVRSRRAAMYCHLFLGPR